MNTAPASTWSAPAQAAPGPAAAAQPAGAFPDDVIETECPHCGALLELDLSAGVSA